MAMCDTHAVGIIPHFTGPVATAALVHCLVTYPGSVLFEYNYGDRKIPYLPDTRISKPASSTPTSGRAWASRWIPSRLPRSGK